MTDLGTRTEEQMPDELWLEVFQQIPRESLKDVALTHRTFTRISRSLLFQDFTFRPYTMRPMPRDGSRRYTGPGADTTLRLPPAEECDRYLERLNFWASSEIAPLVRSCSILPWHPVEWGGWNNTHSPYPLLDAFFDRLPSFTGLQGLYATSVHFTQSGVVHLCCLPALTRLHISMCAVAGQIDCTSLKLAVSSFLIKETGIRSNFDMWIRLLSPDCLVELDLGFGARRHAEVAQTIPSLPQVKNLRLCALKARKHLKLSHNYMILSKFPGLEVLKIQGNPQWDDDPDLISPRSTILSELREYTGPHEMLCILFPRAPLTHLTPNHCDPLSLMKALHGIRACSSITSLTGLFNDFLDVPGFYSLFDIFPRLTKLSMDIVYSGENNANSTAASFMKILASSFPPLLEHLYIHWQRSDFDEYISPVDTARLFRELRALPTRCPALKSIWLESFAFLFRSRRLQDGAVDEYTARTTGERMGLVDYGRLVETVKKIDRIEKMRDKLDALRETGLSWGRGR